MGIDGPNWQALAGFGATGTFARETKGKQTNDEVRTTGEMGSEAGNGVQRMPWDAWLKPDEVAVLERPSTETDEVPVSADDDHPVPPGIIAPTSQGVVL